MERRAIIEDENYQDCFVAMQSFSSSDVIASDKDAKKARDKAIEKGFADPVVFFIPPKGATLLF